MSAAFGPLERDINRSESLGTCTANMLLFNNSGTAYVIITTAGNEYYYAGGNYYILNERIDTIELDAAIIFIIVCIGYNNERGVGDIRHPQFVSPIPT